MWTRDSVLKRKIRRYYLGVAILVVLFINVLLTHALLHKKNYVQARWESQLPYGNYLPNSENPLIRVVLKTNGFGQITHNEVRLSAKKGLIVSVGDSTSEVASGEEILLKPDDSRFQNGTVLVTPKEEGDRITIHSLSREIGVPSYQGVMELFSTAEGIVIVNEVPLETYLCAVVPSEMPASYELEALKCQAVCARSYAYCQMLAFSYPEYKAHVDDSVTYQVYGNCREHEATTKAVNETAGQMVWNKNKVAMTYYFSTSSGYSTSVEAWGTKLTSENKYLSGVAICDKNQEFYEKEYPWHRWEAVIPERLLGNLISLNTGTDIGSLQALRVIKTGVGGVVLEIEATGSKGSVTVGTENKIRSALGGSGYTVKRQDGVSVDSTRLLPSAFFTISKQNGNYILSGGGRGHGIGMSQNGANEMAKEGKSYKEILTFFYTGTKVE